MKTARKSLANVLVSRVQKGLINCESAWWLQKSSHSENFKSVHCIGLCFFFLIKEGITCLDVLYYSNWDKTIEFVVEATNVWMLCWDRERQHTLLLPTIYSILTLYIIVLICRCIRICFICLKVTLNTSTL